eukprot:scaffold20165_cov32-Prasinocladus_malaysianus.AAC.2
MTVVIDRSSNISLQERIAIHGKRLIRSFTAPDPPGHRHSGLSSAGSEDHLSSGPCMSSCESEGTTHGSAAIPDSEALTAVASACGDTKWLVDDAMHILSGHIAGLLLAETTFRAAHMAGIDVNGSAVPSVTTLTKTSTTSTGPSTRL